MVYVIQVCWQLANGSVLILLASCQQTCVTYTIAVCTVKNSWWWTEELSKTYRVLFQKQIWEIPASSLFYLRRRSATACLLRLWVRIPPGAWMSVCFECCVMSGRGLCDELITRPEESYRLWCVVVCDLETSWMRRSWPNGGCCAKKKKVGFIVRI